MKKNLIIPFIILMLLLTGLHQTKAEISQIQLAVSVSNTTAGEKAEYTFEVAPLDEPSDSEEWITILTPKEILVPTEIKLTDIELNESTHPIDCKVVRNQSIELLIPPMEEDHLQVVFRAAGQFTNPTSTKAVDFTLVWEKRSIMVFSNKVVFTVPESSVEYQFSEAQAVPYWYNQPVSLTLTSSLAENILFTINDQTETQYTEPVLFQHGKHEVAITGVRSSGVREETIELTIQIDEKEPILQIISPEDNLITNQLTIPMVLSLQDASKVQLVLQKKTYYIESDEGPVEINLPLTLQDGVNQIPWKAVDEVGFEISGSLVIHLDRTPPALTVYTPRKGDIICGDRVEITGKSEPGSQLYMGEKSIPLDVFGNFSMFLVPVRGKNSLILRSQDPAGNETRVQVDYVFYDGKTVEIWIDQDIARVEGEEMPISPPPIMEPNSGEIYLPLRFIPSVLAYQLEWNARDSVAILKRNNVQILIKPNDSKIRIKTDGKTENLDLNHPPLLINKVIMIPAEFLKKILGAELLFDEEEQRLFINFCDRSES